MVTNLPENAKAQWKRVVLARTPEEKLKELKKFYSMIPKHKGTKNLVKYVRRKMAVLKEEIEERKKKGKVRGRYVSSWDQGVHGIARISLVGFSQAELVKAFKFITGRRVKEGFMFEPIYGILDDGEIQFQVVMLPPVIPGSLKASRIFSYLPTSRLVFFISTSHDFSDFEEFSSLSESEGVVLKEKGGEVKIERLPSGGIRVVGSLMDSSNKELIELLRSYGIRNAVVKIFGDVTLTDVENEILGLRKYVPCVQLRLAGSEFVLRDGSQVLAIRSKKELSEFILHKLSLIRVYTKLPREGPSNEPIVLKEGSTIEELARSIHSWLIKHFNYAVIWRNGKQMKVSRSFKLKDGDIVEIRTR